MKQRQFIREIGKSVLMVTALWLAVGGSALAQATLAVSLDAVDAGTHPTLRALVTVTDENGIPMRGLDQKAFELNEDGHGPFAPDKVEVVANQKAAVAVLVLVDLSGSMRGAPLQKAKEAIGKFLEALLNEPNDPDRAAFMGSPKVAVTSDTISDDTRQVGLPTTWQAAQRHQLCGRGQYRRHAALRRHLSRGQDHSAAALAAVPSCNDRWRKDQAAHFADSDPINEANRQRIPIFPIGLSTGRLDSQYLQRLAVRTGGQFQSAPAPEQLTQLLQNVLAQLKEQYVLTYSSRIPQVDGQPHTLSVQVETSRGTSSSKLTFMLGQPATPAPTTASATAALIAPVATPVPAASPTSVPAPTSGGGKMIQWVNDNLVLTIAIAAALLLLLLMIIIVMVLVLRRRSGREPAYEAPAYTPPLFTGAPFPMSPLPTADRHAAGHIVCTDGGWAGRFGRTGNANSLVGRALRLAPKTGPGPAQPFRPLPPLAPRQPTASFVSAFQARPESQSRRPRSGGTVIIQRGPKLKVLGMLVDKKESSRRFDIDKPMVTIGRAPGNSFIVEHATVSRQHATIKIEGEEFGLYDLGSANGTFVNDKRVREPVTLHDGDTVRLGEAEFIFKRVVL
jgi:hypothetical protein